jgi:hypothetical protein
MHPQFDLGTQLLDLTAVLTEDFEDLAVDLSTELVRLTSSPRMLRHALTIVSRGRQDCSRTFGEYISMVGGEEMSKIVKEASDRRTWQIDQQQKGSLGNPARRTRWAPGCWRWPPDLANCTIAMWVRPATVAEHLVPRLGAGARVVVVGVRVDHG